MINGFQGGWRGVGWVARMAEKEEEGEVDDHDNSLGWRRGVGCGCGGGGGVRGGGGGCRQVGGGGGTGGGRVVVVVVVGRGGGGRVVSARPGRDPEHDHGAHVAVSAECQLDGILSLGGARVAREGFAVEK